MIAVKTHFADRSRQAVPFIEHDVLGPISSGDISRFLAILGGSNCVLKHLRTLQFLSWPRSENVSGVICRSYYDSLLQRISTAMFQAMKSHDAPSPCLKVIAFGNDSMDEKYTEDDFSLFISGSLSVPGSASQITALQVTSRWLKYAYDTDTCILGNIHAQRFLPHGVIWKRESFELSGILDLV